MLLKIVFWSEEAACGTTSNMIATASMIAAKHNCRVAMLSAEKNVHDLVGNFARPDSATVNEECSYYVLEGLDYLLMAGKYGSLTEHHLEEALQPVVDGKLFCLPQGKRMLCDFYPKETRNVLNLTVFYMHPMKTRKGFRSFLMEKSLQEQGRRKSVQKATMHFPALIFHVSP